MLTGMTTSRPERAPQDADKFIVRLPAGLRDSLKARAASNNRSMNAEILAILGAAMGDPSNLGGLPVEALLKEAAARLGATVQINVVPASKPLISAPETSKKAKAK